MKKQNENYYGIYFNKDVPKFDKVNKYRKEVEIKFEGRTFLVERDEDNKIVKRTELENNYKFKKEGKYELEFINNLDRTFHIDLKIRMSYLIIILFLFFFGVLIGLLLSNPKLKDNKHLAYFYDFIDFSVIEVDIDKEKDVPKEYNFDVEFESISSTDINLTDTISANTVARNKIAPGVSGSFAIIINSHKSSVDMNYVIKFEDVVKEKPTNMSFKIRDTEKECSTLQELEKVLNGRLAKNSKEKIIIDWEWKYETLNNNNSIIENDLLDTNEGENLESYKFKIIVDGEESL